MDNKIKNAMDFYMLATTLKTKLRTGWIYWNLKSDRFESIAEHIYGVSILAIALDSEFNFNIDINKVIKMLTIHELEECIIGDQTPFDMSLEEKERLGHLAVHNILKDLIKGEELEKLVLEFDGHETNESKFAYMCDKLEADLQAKRYDSNGCFDLKEQVNNPALKSKTVLNIIDNGTTNVGDIWLEYDKDKFVDNDTFNKILKFVKNNY